MEPDELNNRAWRPSTGLSPDGRTGRYRDAARRTGPAGPTRMTRVTHARTGRLAETWAAG